MEGLRNVQTFVAGPLSDITRLAVRVARGQTDHMRILVIKQLERQRSLLVQSAGMVVAGILSVITQHVVRIALERMGPIQEAAMLRHLDEVDVGVDQQTLREPAVGT